MDRTGPLLTPVYDADARGSSVRFAHHKQLSRRGRLLALFGHGEMSDVSLLSRVKRKLDFGTVRSAFDPIANVSRGYRGVLSSEGLAIESVKFRFWH
jgi:hypothetical protein